MLAQKATIQHQLGKIGARGDAITQNVDNVKRMIQQRCERAMLEVERLGQEKVCPSIVDRDMRSHDLPVS